MRNLSIPEIERYRNVGARVREMYGGVGDWTCGVFEIPSYLDLRLVHVIASVGEGWDHVSVSRPTRCPTWLEMEQVKRLFFHPDEVCMELHVAVAEHLSLHDYCLHLWRPNDGREIPLPPPWMVAVPEQEAG